jgi:hypothetical protein
MPYSTNDVVRGTWIHLRHRHTSVNARPRGEGENGTQSFPLREAPKNPREETERVERLVERVLEEHSETIKKLADE